MQEDNNNDFDDIKRNYKEAREEYHSAKMKYKQAKRRHTRNRHGLHDININLDDLLDFTGSHNIGEKISYIVNTVVKTAMNGLNDIISGISDFDLDMFTDFDFDMHSYRNVNIVRPERQRVNPGTDIKIEPEKVNESKNSSDLILQFKYSKEVLLQVEKEIQDKESLAVKLGLADESSLSSVLEYLAKNDLIIQEKAGDNRFMITQKGKNILTLNLKQAEYSNAVDEENNG